MACKNSNSCIQLARRQCGTGKHSSPNFGMCLSPLSSYRVSRPIHAPCEYQWQIQYIIHVRAFERYMENEFSDVELAYDVARHASYGVHFA